MRLTPFRGFCVAFAAGLTVLVAVRQAYVLVSAPPPPEKPANLVDPSRIV